MKTNDPRLRAPLLAAGAAVLTFLPVLRHSFVNWDDDVVLSHPMLGSLSPLWMLTSVWSATWQPLTWALDSALWAAFGPNAAVFHAVNLALHAACSALLVLVARELMLRAKVPAARVETGALLAGLLLAVHPLSAEPASWFSAQGDLLSSALLLGAALAHLRGRARAVLVLGVLSCLARWKGALLPVALLLVDELPPKSRDVRAKVPLIACAAATVALNALAKSRALGYSGTPKPLDAAQGLMFLAGKWIAPARLLPVYETSASAAALAVVAALTVGAWLVRRRRPELFAAWAWFVAALLPVLAFSEPGRPIALHDYHAYLACAGFAVLAGAGLSRAPVLGFVLCAGLAFGARAQSLTWRDSETLWRAALAKTPDSPHALFRLALELRRQGRTAEALVPAERLYALDPERGRSIVSALKADASTTR